MNRLLETAYDQPRDHAKDLKRVLAGAHSTKTVGLALMGAGVLPQARRLFR
jgi:hypothetical protein